MTWWKYSFIAVLFESLHEEFKPFYSITLDHLFQTIFHGQCSVLENENGCLPFSTDELTINATVVVLVLLAIFNPDCARSRIIA